jgi:hypothetical protein
MKTMLNVFDSIVFALALAVAAGSATAQTISANAGNSGGGPAKTDRSIEYHGGPVLTGVQDVYFIFYGCWGTSVGTSGCHDALGQ